MDIMWVRVRALKCRYWLSRVFAPIQSFTLASQATPATLPHWIATIPLQGADESNTRIQWTPNNHININVYTQTKIALKDGTAVEIPCYHHAFIAPPKGARSLDTIQREWHKGYLILSFKGKSESTPSADASL